MIDYASVLQGHPELVKRIIEYFTAESTNPVLFEEIKEIGVKWGKHFNKPNAEVFMKLGYLSVFDFSLYQDEKHPGGIKMLLVEMTLKLLEEKLIILPIEQMLVGNGDRRYKSNGEYTKMLYQSGLIDNLIFGFNYILSKYQKSVFKIEHIDKNQDHSIGTGFLISNEGEHFIATNKHVIDGAVKLRLFDKEGYEISYNNPFVDEKSDLALLPLTTLYDAPTFILNPSIEILSEIITIGYPSIPMTKDAYQVYHKGEVNSFVEDYHGNKLFLISAKTSSGNSGSPIIDKTGLVIGIITEELFEKELFNKKGKLPYYAAIPGTEILRLLDEYKQKY